MSTKTWTTRDGTKLHVKDMSSEHLVNVKAFLERAAQRKHQAEVSFFISCPAPTAECALDDFEKAFDEMLEIDWEDYLPEIYYDILEEIGQRDQSDDFPTIFRDEDNMGDDN